VAHAAHYGSVRIEAFAPDRMCDPAIRAMLPHIQVSLDPEVDAEFPSRRAARIAIMTRDGRTFSHYQPTRKGDPDLPLSDDELNAKFIELTSPILGSISTNALLKKLWKLETIDVASIATSAVIRRDDETRNNLPN
jgi:2-methylcitrate dehydratase PrpD